MKNKTNFFTESYIIRGREIATRFFFAPINTGYSNNGAPTSRLIEFHASRSGKKIGISYVGNVAIGAQFVTNNSTLYLSDNEDKWLELTQTISSNDSLPAIQLGCRYSKIQPIKSWKNTDILKYLEDVKSELDTISKEEIELIEENFIKSALKAISLGFEVIQIHAAHGYFLSLLLSNKFNIRKDEYGENKTLLLEKIIKKIRESSPEAILDIRISLLEGLDSEDFEIEYKKEVIKEICKLDVDIISISHGIYNVNKEFIYPPADWGHGVYIDKVLPFSMEYPDILWNIAGNIWDLNKINQHIPNNVTFSIGRSIIADSEFVRKTIDGKTKEINKCNRCNLCHYYSLGKSYMECKINSI